MRPEASSFHDSLESGLDLQQRFPRTPEGSKSGRAGPDPADSVTVCICTFRRRSIFQAVSSVAHQQQAEQYLSRIVVIDNDDHDGLRAEMEAFAIQLPVRLDYIHAPRKNISIARNAALDAVETRYLAFIDDDEEAQPDWLKTLFGQRNEAHVIVGSSQAIYDERLQQWVERCDFHSNLPNKDPSNAHTSNVLIDMNFVQDTNMRFLEELGLTGGEDTVFFRSLAHAGARFAAAPEAVVIEGVPANRANMRWVLRRMYRAGQTHGLVCKMFDHRVYRKLLLTAGAKALVSALVAVIVIPGTDRSRKWFARAALHAGAFHYRLKPSMLQEYA